MKKKLYYWSLTLLMVIHLSILAQQKPFIYQYDYQVQEYKGIRRTAEPLHITLSAKDNEVVHWKSETQVIRIDVNPYQQVPFQIYGITKTPLTQSANLVFLARCQAKKKAIYRILWGKSKKEKVFIKPSTFDLKVMGKAPALTVQNCYYQVKLAKKSGSINKIHFFGGKQKNTIRFYRAYKELPSSSLGSRF